MPTITLKWDLFKWGLSGVSPPPEMQSWVSLDYDVSGATGPYHSSRDHVTFREPVLGPSIYNQNRPGPMSVWSVPSIVYLAGGGGIENAMDNQGNVWALSKSIDGGVSGRDSSPIGEPLTPAFNGTGFAWQGYDTGYGITRSGYSVAPDRTTPNLTGWPQP